MKGYVTWHNLYCIALLPYGVKSHLCFQVCYAAYATFAVNIFVVLIINIVLELRLFEFIATDCCCAENPECQRIRIRSKTHF